MVLARVGRIVKDVAHEGTVNVAQRGRLRGLTPRQAPRRGGGAVALPGTPARCTQRNPSTLMPYDHRHVSTHVPPQSQRPVRRLSHGIRLRSPGPMAYSAPPVGSGQSWKLNAIRTSSPVGSASPNQPPSIPASMRFWCTQATATFASTGQPGVSPARMRASARARMSVLNSSRLWAGQRRRLLAAYDPTRPQEGNQQPNRLREA